MPTATAGDARRPDLVDVVFSSGIRTIGGVTRLSAGTSDAEAHGIEIGYPFDVPLARNIATSDVSTLIAPAQRLQA